MTCQKRRRDIGVVKAISLARARARERERKREIGVAGNDRRRGSKDNTASRVGTVDYIYEPRINKSDYGLYGLRMRR